MSKQGLVLIVVGAYLWVMLILFGSIVLETFMVYLNIFHDPPRSLATALEFMKVRAPSDLYPPLGFLSWVLGAASAIATRRTPDAVQDAWLRVSGAIEIWSTRYSWPTPSASRCKSRRCQIVSASTWSSGSRAIRSITRVR